MARMVVTQLPIIITIKVLNRVFTSANRAFISERSDSTVPFTSANRAFVSERNDSTVPFTYHH